MSLVAESGLKNKQKNKEQFVFVWEVKVFCVCVRGCGSSRAQVWGSLCWLWLLSVVRTRLSSNISGLLEREGERELLSFIPSPPQTPVLCLYSSSQISLVYDSSRFIWPLIRQETAAREPASLILSHPHPRTALIFIYNCINDAIPVVLMVCLLRGKKTLAYIFGEETRLLYEICHVCHVRV